MNHPSKPGQLSKLPMHYCKIIDNQSFAGSLTIVAFRDVAGRTLQDPAVPDPCEWRIVFQAHLPDA